MSTPPFKNESFCATLLVLRSLYGAVSDLLAPSVEDDLDPAVVLAFGVFGLLFDALALAAFRTLAASNRSIEFR